MRAPTCIRNRSFQGIQGMTITIHRRQPTLKPSAAVVERAPYPSLELIGGLDLRRSVLVLILIIREQLVVLLAS